MTAAEPENTAQDSTAPFMSMKPLYCLMCSWEIFVFCGDKIRYFWHEVSVQTQNVTAAEPETTVQDSTAPFMSMKPMDIFQETLEDFSDACVATKMCFLQDVETKSKHDSCRARDHSSRRHFNICKHETTEYFRDVLFF